jgi:hypothetical protein
MKDYINEYLHVVITPSLDECSNAQMSDLIRLSRTLKHTVKNFKTALIPYMAKGNEELKRELL